MQFSSQSRFKVKGKLIHFFNISRDQDSLFIVYVVYRLSNVRLEWRPIWLQVLTCCGTVLGLSFYRYSYYTHTELIYSDRVLSTRIKMICCNLKYTQIVSYLSISRSLGCVRSTNFVKRCSLFIIFYRKQEIEKKNTKPEITNMIYTVVTNIINQFLHTNPNGYFPR